MEVRYATVDIEMIDDIDRRSTLKHVYKNGKTLDRSIALMSSYHRIERGKVLVFVGGRASLLEQLTKGGPKGLMLGSGRLISGIGVRASQWWAKDLTGLCFGEMDQEHVPSGVQRKIRSTPLEKAEFLKLVGDLLGEMKD
jgi:hypothetical protein